MKRRVALVLVWIMIINMLLFTSCGKEGSNSSQNPSGAVANPGVRVNGYPDESLVEYISASPFYTPEHLEGIYGNSEYLGKRDVLINNIMSLSDIMVQNLEYFLALSDELQWEVLSNYKYFSELDAEVHLVHEMIRDKYTMQMVQTAEILSRIRTLEKTDSQDSYINAWNDYYLVQKRLELTTLTFERIMEITEDNQLLRDYVEERGNLSTDIGVFMTTDSIFDQFPQDDPYVERQYLNMAELLKNLKALQEADTYATIWAIEDTIASVEEDLNKIVQVEKTDRLNETELDLLKSALTLQKEMLIGHREVLMESKGLQGELSSALNSEEPTMGGVQDLLIEIQQYLDKPVYADGEDNLEKAVQILQETKRGEEENREISKGFFASMKEKLSSARKSTASFVGRYLEKASTVTYKASITVVGSYYGISKEDIEDEKRDAEELEKQRLLDGTAGSQVIRDGIAWLEDKEQWIGEIAKDALGEDSRTARLIGYGSKFAIQKYTSASKSMMVLIDSNSTDEEIANAFSDVVVTTLGELKVLENTIGRLDKDRLEKALGIYDDAMDVFNISKDLVTDENNRYTDRIISDLEERIVQMEENELVEMTVENLDQVEEIAVENTVEQLEFLYGETGSEAFGGYKTSAFDLSLLEVAKDLVESGVSADIDLAGMELEDNSSPDVENEEDLEDNTEVKESEDNKYTEEETDLEDNDVATDNGGVIEEKSLDDKTEGKLTGTYTGVIYAIDTIWGSVDLDDPVQLVITDNQMVLSNTGPSELFETSFSFSHTIVQTDINYVAGVGKIPDHYFELLDGGQMYDSQIGCRITSYTKGKGQIDISYGNQFAGTIYFEVEK
ncbi:hypothetical protein [Gudongella sp. DL1XJH-153]|uniref:hypothetical protein n=1 Tax=Gudongella sp. DL1XJH-153 TaxID=3409804 RepID=UPI003BB5064F